MDTSIGITYASLLEEGEQIRALIKYVPETSDVIFRSYSEYKISDTGRYETWRNLAVNFLLSKCENQRLEDFKSASIEFKKKHYSPECFDNMLGIIKACQLIPCQKEVSTTSTNQDKAFVLNINQSQTQSQSQEQKQALDIFIEAIKDELTGKQVKELKAIAKEEPNQEKAKTRVLNKIKSWSGDVLANIIANIVTNPTVWNGLLG